MWFSPSLSLVYLTLSLYVVVFYISLFSLFVYFVCLFCYFFKSRPTYQVEKINEVGVCQRLVCQKREFVRSSSCEVYDSKLKNGIFFRIDMKHSYFLFPINFSVVETVAKN